MFKNQGSLNAVAATESLAATIRGGAGMQSVSLACLCIDYVFQFAEVARARAQKLFLQRNLYDDIRQITP